MGLRSVGTGSGQCTFLCRASWWLICFLCSSLHHPLALPAALDWVPAESLECTSFSSAQHPETICYLCRPGEDLGPATFLIPQVKGSRLKDWVCLKIKADYKALTLYLQKKQPFSFLFRAICPSSFWPGPSNNPAAEDPLKVPQHKMSGK